MGRAMPACVCGPIDDIAEIFPPKRPCSLCVGPPCLGDRVGFWKMNHLGGGVPSCVLDGKAWRGRGGAVFLLLRRRFAGYMVQGTRCWCNLFMSSPVTMRVTRRTEWHDGERRFFSCAGATGIGHPVVGGVARSLLCHGAPFVCFAGAYSDYYVRGLVKGILFICVWPVRGCYSQVDEFRLIPSTCTYEQ